MCLHLPFIVHPVCEQERSPSACYSLFLHLVKFSFLLLKVIVNLIAYVFDLTGFFLIRRGTDECGIEDGVTAGVPAM